MRKLTGFWFALLVAALLLTGCGKNASPAADQSTPAPTNAVIAEGHVRPEQGVTLAFQARGTVAEIMVKEGQKVKKGDALIRLTDYDQAQAALTAARLELTTAQQEYDTLVRTADLDRAKAWQAYMDAQVTRAAAERKWENLNLDNIEDRIDDAKAEVEDRQTDLKDAQEDFDKYKGLDKDNSKRKQAEDDLENAQEDYNEAVRKLESIQRERDSVRAALDKALAVEAEARHQYELFSADGPNADQLALAQARLDNAKAQVAAAQEALDNYELKAPFDGLVADVSVDVGEQVGPEMPAVSVANFSKWIVETTDVTELEVINLTEGQKATLVPDALPDLSMTGVIESISQAYTQQGGDILYTVRIRVDELDPRIRWGMTVEVTFKPIEE